MDSEDAKDLARQLREHLGYKGDQQQFEDEIVHLVSFVVERCASIVEETPSSILFVSENPLSLIAAAIRGKFLA